MSKHKRTRASFSDWLTNYAVTAAKWGRAPEDMSRKVVDYLQTWARCGALVNIKSPADLRHFLLGRCHVDPKNVEFLHFAERVWAVYEQGARR
jgi:hypothetical protein